MCVLHVLDIMEFFFMDKIKQEIALKENQVQILQDKIKDYEKRKNDMRKNWKC